MISTIFLVKTALLRFGVVIQGVSFDVDHELIEVKYTLKGKEQTKSIPFSQIEELFTSKATDPAGYQRPYYAPPEHP